MIGKPLDTAMPRMTLSLCEVRYRVAQILATMEQCLVKDIRKTKGQPCTSRRRPGSVGILDSARTR